MDQNLTSTPPKKIGFSEPNVLPEVQKVRAPEPRKETWDIFKADFLRNGASIDDASEYYDTIEKGIQNNTVRVLRNGNSLLVVFLVSPGVANVDLFHDTSAKNIVDDVIEFAKAFKVAGFKKITLNALPEKVGKLAKIAADSVGVKYNVAQQPDGEYLVEWTT